MAALCLWSFAKKIPTFPSSPFTKCRCRRFVRNSNPSVSSSSGRSSFCRGSTSLFFHQVNRDGSVSSIWKVKDATHRIMFLCHGIRDPRHFQSEPCAIVELSEYRHDEPTHAADDLS